MALVNWGETKNDLESGKLNQTPTIAPSADVSLNIDFFQTYDLIKYTANSPQYNGFLPIRIRSTPILDNKTADHDKNIEVDITLPWKVGEISDSVSVTYNRRGDALGTSTLLQYAGALLENAGMPHEFAKWAIAEYNPKDLTKTLDIEFILPLASSRTGAYDLKFCKDVRTGLGALQGLVYPRAFGFQYPPFLKVDLGGIYKGFKAFLREVSLRFSEEMIDVGGEMFPQVITGNLRFINVFMYTWDSIGLDHFSVISNFSLSKQPEILFGADKLEGGSVSASANKTEKSNKEVVSQKEGSAITKMIDRTKNLNTTIINDANLDTKSFSKNWINNDNPYSILQTFDKNSFDLLNQKQSNILNIIDNGQLDFLDINQIGDKSSLIHTIKNKMDSIGDIHSYANVIFDLKNGGKLNTLGIISQIVKTSNRSLSNTIEDVRSILTIGSHILGHLEYGVDLSNAPYLFHKLQELIDYLDAMEIKKESKNKLYSGIFANNLKTESIYNNVNNINRTNNEISSFGDSLTPVSHLYTGFNQMLNYDIMSSGIVNIKESNKKIFEKASVLYNNKFLDKTALLKIENIMDDTDKIDVDSLASASYNLFDLLEETMRDLL